MADEEPIAIRRKIRSAARLLFFKRHMKPGVKAWELKRVLGQNYLEIVRLLDEEINKFGFYVKALSDERGEEKSHFFIVMKEPPKMAEARTFGWRIDDLAILAATLTYVLSRQGKASFKDVERLLHDKFPKWKVEYNINRFIRMGYLSEDEEGMVYVGWRTRLEVDQKKLLDLLIGREKG